MAEQNAGKFLGSYLDEKILNQGIQQSNFFNGRILTAQDLQDDQLANRNRQQQLGQAIGEGIVTGLEVELAAGADGSDGNPPVLHISPGLAFNRLGQAIALSVDVSLTLARKPSPLPAEAGLFKTCPPGITSADFHDRNVYILVASPASGYSGKAPQRGFNDGKVIGCGDRYAIEGVQFRTEELKVNTLSQLSQSTCDALDDLMSKDDDASLSKLRNGLAHLFFGTEAKRARIADPFGAATGSDGVIDALRTSRVIGECDIPLTLVYWTGRGVKFADMWAVRRRIDRPGPDHVWQGLCGDRCLAEGEAAFMQFQAHLDWLLGRLNRNSQAAIRAVDCFFYLPAAGLLPLIGIDSAGVDGKVFWQTRTVRDPDSDPLYLEGADLPGLLRKALTYPPINLGDPEMIWLYRIRENQQSAIPVGIGTPRACQLFTIAQIPPRGSRFNCSRWNYGNFA